MNDPPKRPNTDMSWAFTPAMYGPPPRPPTSYYYKHCMKCGISIEDEIGFLCPNCYRLELEYQTRLDQYMRDLIRYFRSQNWTYEQCKHALEEGLKVNTK